ncbi:MAG: ATP-binding protein [Candidatus Harrisonbacteria bacterium]|nr:ATP-binding protein [Candidatus Harrisonbacteria bacterium]
MKVRKKIKDYLVTEQMRIFWIFLSLALISLILSAVYVPLIVKIVILLLFLSMVGLVLTGSIKGAQARYEKETDHNLLEALVENLQDAVVAYDQDFKILVFNKAAEELFGIQEKEILESEFNLKSSGQNPKFNTLRQVIFPSLAPNIYKLSPAGQYPQVVDLKFSSPYLELRTVTMPIEGLKGKTGGYIKVIKDRTREVGLVDSKDEFVTVASHQMRTPLSAVNWAFQELSKAGLAEKDKNEILATGQKAVKRLTNVVNDFLNLAKIEEGRFGYQFEKGDIAAFLGQVIEEAEPIAKQNGVSVFYTKPQESFELVFDKQKIGTVVSNLIDNAIKYNVKNGQVLVRIKRKESEPYVQIEVEDTGVGIKPEEIDRIFTKFFRSETTVKMDTTGTGIGLYIAKNIVNQHGGQIWAKSTLGRGSIFAFTLPTDETLIPSRELGKLGR